MKRDARSEKLAQVLWWGLRKARSSPFKKGDVVLIRYDRHALQQAQVVYRMLLKEGLHPVQHVNPSSEMELDFFSLASDEQLEFVPPGSTELAKKLNGIISLRAPSSLNHLGNVASSKIGQWSRARKRVRRIMEQREQSGDFGWTLTTLPTRVLAKAAELTIAEYSVQTTRACFLDEEDPVMIWERLYCQADRLKKWLNTMPVVKYQVESENIDLTVPLGQCRRWIGVSGHNIPSFELFVSPDWRGVEGVYSADQPSYKNGNYVRGVRLEFRRGSVSLATAQEGESFLKALVATDAGAGRLGEFSLTDRRFSRINRFMADTLYDENYGGKNGNCHIALGFSYADTYAGDPASLNKKEKTALGFNDSAIHWDLVNTESKRVTAYLKDGSSRIIYKEGEFQTDL